MVGQINQIHRFAIHAAHDWQIVSGEYSFVLPVNCHCSFSIIFLSSIHSIISLLYLPDLTADG